MEPALPLWFRMNYSISPLPLTSTSSITLQLVPGSLTDYPYSIGFLASLKHLHVIRMVLESSAYNQNTSMEPSPFSIVNLDRVGCRKCCQVEEYKFQMVRNMHWAMSSIPSNMLLGDHHKLFARMVQSKNLGYASTKNWRWVSHFLPLNNSLQFVAIKCYSHE